MLKSWNKKSKENSKHWKNFEEVALTKLQILLGLLLKLLLKENVHKYYALIHSISSNTTYFIIFINIYVCLLLCYWKELNTFLVKL